MNIWIKSDIAKLKHKIVKSLNTLLCTIKYILLSIGIVLCYEF